MAHLIQRVVHELSLTHVVRHDRRPGGDGLAHPSGNAPLIHFPKGRFGKLEFGWRCLAAMQPFRGITHKLGEIEDGRHNGGFAIDRTEPAQQASIIGPDLFKKMVEATGFA